MLSSDQLKFAVLGGLGEIGMNCFVIEGQNDLFLIDCGMMFTDLDFFGVEYIIPDFSYVLERKEKFRGFLITHGHEDHIGALPYAIRQGLRGPVYCTRFTRQLVQKKLENFGCANKCSIETIAPQQSLNLGEFEILPVQVNHSIADAVGLIIKTKLGNIVHTGDFRIDDKPYFGSTIDNSTFKKAGDEGVILLLSDSTNVETLSDNPSESEIIPNFDRYLKQSDGATMFTLFSSNVARLGMIFQLAQSLNKKVALLGRSVEDYYASAQGAGYLLDSKTTVVSPDDISSIDRNELIVVASGCQGEYRSTLNRIAIDEHRNFKLLPGDQVIFSSKFIPGNEKNIGRVINNLYRRGAIVHHNTDDVLHVSGHATRPELRKMLEWTRPKFFLPVHGEYRHLVHHAELAEEVGIPHDNILVAVNGDIVSFDLNEGLQVEGQLEETRVMIDGEEGNVITRPVLKARRQLAESGAIFCLLRDGDPKVAFKGIANADLEKILMKETEIVASKIINQLKSQPGMSVGSEDFLEAARIELRRFFNRRMGKKLPVIPVAD